MPINDVYSLLTYEEGCRLFAYDDYDSSPLKPGQRCIGHPSIGVGRALDREGISQDESDAMLTHDVQKWVAGLSKYPWFLALDNVRKAGIVSMAHAMGLQGVLDFSDMIAALTAEDWQRAHDALLASRWATEAPQRVQRLANMLLSGAWPAVAV